MGMKQTITEKWHKILMAKPRTTSGVVITHEELEEFDEDVRRGMPLPEIIMYYRRRGYKPSTNFEIGDSHDKD